MRAFCAWVADQSCSVILPTANIGICQAASSSQDEDDGRDRHASKKQRILIEDGVANGASHRAKNSAALIECEMAEDSTKDATAR